MPEPFKNLFNADLIGAMARHLGRVSGEFDAAEFERRACQGLHALELKARCGQICTALEVCLPADFEQACALLNASLHPEKQADLRQLTMDDQGIRGWAIMPMAEYVARHGLPYFDVSMTLLGEMTQRFTAEFAVRPFIIQQPEQAFHYLHQWAEQDNYHLRRLASEGSRPRLPWGQQITHLIKNPEPLLPLLEKLMDDGHEYVRRSVANNLNDISKDHPELLVNVARRWWAEGSSDRRRLIRHAGRTLIKQGHQPLLQVLGFHPPEIHVLSAHLKPQKIRLGEAIQLAFSFQADSINSQALVVDYVIWHQRKTAGPSAKVFKWKTLTAKPGQSVHLTKAHSFKAVTTRVYYPGVHQVDIQVNGVKMHSFSFELCE